MGFWRIQFTTIALREERRRHQHSRAVREPSLGTECTSLIGVSRSCRRAAGEDEVTLAWLADQLRTFVDLHPEFETPVERLATWLARLDDANE